jgi:hypothetical protein
MDEYLLEDIQSHNVIQAELFTPFTIARLQPLAVATQAVILNVQLKNIGEPSTRHRTLRLVWSTESPITVPPMQEHIVTEWAAVGIACVVIPLYTGLQVRQVTQIGDSFDYWVGDEKREYALEVSGTVQGNLRARHNAKVRQLQRNPYEVAGYVVVVRFASRECILSFHHSHKERR